MTDPIDPKAFEGISGIVAKPLERVNVRSRESQVTQSAWKLEVTSPKGSGAILVVEISPQQTLYRGEGLFLGWSQERLAGAYRALAPKSEDTDPELPQLG